MKTRWVEGLLALCLASVAALSVWLATANGMSYGQRDSPTYVSSAQSLAAGSGYRTPFGDPGKPVDFDHGSSPVVDFPPGYPLALSAGIAAGLEPTMAARIASSLIVAVIGALIFAFARRRGLGMTAGVLAALVGVVLTIPQSLAPQSEPLYGLLLIGAVWSAAEYVERRGRLALVSALVLTVGAVAVRTVGLALVGSLMLLVFMTERKTLRRLAGPAVVGVLGMLPFLLTSGTGSRVPAWHPMDMTDLKTFANAVAGWLVPPVFTPTVRVVISISLLLVSGAWLAVAARRSGRSSERDTSGSRRWWAGAASAVGHLGVLVLTIFFFDSQTSLGSRLIYPIALSLLMTGVEVFAIRSGRLAEPVSRVFPVLAIAAIVAGTWASIAAASAVRGGERLFASDEFARSESVLATISHGDSFTVYSNVPDGLWVAGLAGARPLPIVVDPLSEEPSPNLLAEEKRLKDEVVSENAMIFYYRLHERPYLLDEESVRELATCSIIDDGRSLLLVSSHHPLCPVSS